MSSATTPPPILSAFTSLRGGLSQAIAPGPELITLGGGATWWEHDAPVTVALPGVPSDGARWLPDGKHLRVGIGTLDLVARAWHPEPGLEVWGRPGPDGALPVKAAAWLPDAQHVALLVATRGRDGRRTTEIVIAAADGTLRGRRAIEGATALATAADRVLVAAPRPTVLDRSAAVVAEPALPDGLIRVREGAGTFTAVGAAGEVALVRASDGAVVATWDAHAFDAVPVAHGVVAIDLEAWCESPASRPGASTRSPRPRRAPRARSSRSSAIGWSWRVPVPTQCGSPGSPARAGDPRATRGNAASRRGERRRPQWAGECCSTSSNKREGGIGHERHDGATTTGSGECSRSNMRPQQVRPWQLDEARPTPPKPRRPHRVPTTIPSLLRSLRFGGAVKRLATPRNGRGDFTLS